MRRLFIISSPLLLLTGCGPAQSTFNSHGPAADRIATLSWFMTILFLVVTFIMWVLIAWGFKRRRGTLAEHAPVDAGGGQAWIGIGGLIVPLIVLSVIFIWGLKLLADFPIHGPHNEPGKPDILITGHQWWWEVEYLNDSPAKEFTTANEIHLPVGRPVNIEFHSADVIHAFWVPALHGKVDLIPGRSNFMRIEASDPGNYASSMPTCAYSSSPKSQATMRNGSSTNASPLLNQHPRRLWPGRTFSSRDPAPCATRFEGPRRVDELRPILRT